MDHIDLEVLTVRQGADLESVLFCHCAVIKFADAESFRSGVSSDFKKNTSFFYFRLKCVTQNPSCIRVYLEIAKRINIVWKTLVKYQK